MAPRKWPHRRQPAATSNAWRSGLEEKVGRDLTERGVPFLFEELEVTYQIPATEHRYTPDFILNNGVIIETKGYFEPDDRKKHLYVRDSAPQLDIRFLFQRASTPIRKGSKTTYAMWCEKNGFKWAEKRVPQEWIDEASKN